VTDLEVSFTATTRIYLCVLRGKATSNPRRYPTEPSLASIVCVFEGRGAPLFDLCCCLSTVPAYLEYDAAREFLLSARWRTSLCSKLERA
jgi:hypothetical protein